MPKTLVDRREIDFAPEENTFGLTVIREEWDVSGARKIYWKYGLPDVVQVLGMTEENKVIAIKEFQPGVGAEYFHLVAETMEPGEKPLQAASRGLLEETGYRAGELILLSAILESSGRSDRLIYLVLATVCRKMAHGEMEIETQLVDPPKFWKTMMDYFDTNFAKKHGGGNTLKLMTLAFNKLGFLKLNASCLAKGEVK